MQEIFFKLKRYESSLIFKEMDKKLREIISGSEYQLYGCFGDKFRKVNIFLLKKDIERNEYRKQIEYIKKINLLREIDVARIKIKKVNSLDDLDYALFDNNDLCFSNFVYSQEKNITNIDNFSENEKEDLVNFLKLQNEYLLDSVIVDKSMFSMLFTLNIDIIIKISQKNEMGYFNELFKSKECDFANVLSFLLMKSKEETISSDLNSKENFKLIHQYIDHYGVKEIERIYLKYLEDPYFEKMVVENIDDLTYAYILNKSILLDIVNVANDKKEFLFKKEDNYINIKDDEILIDFSRFFLEIKTVFNAKFLNYLHSEIDRLHNADLFVKRNRVFVKKGNIVDIKNNYQNVLDKILENAKKECIEVKYLESEEIKDIIRDGYLASVTVDKNEKNPKVKKKI